MEEWKVIQKEKDCNYFYKISNLGNFIKVQVLKNNVNKETYVKHMFNDRNGYYSVSIYGKKQYVHRLVAQYFCEGYDKELQVNHIDGNKGNNTYTNLEWVTGKENMEHASNNNLINKHSEKRKQQCRENAKLSYDSIRKPIVQLTDEFVVVKIYNSISEASLQTGIERNNISRSLRSPLRAGGYRWITLEDYKNNKHLSLENVGELNGSKKVVQKTLDGEVVQTFRCIREAEEVAYGLRSELGLKKTRKGSFREAVKNGSEYLNFIWEII